MPTIPDSDLPEEDDQEDLTIDRPPPSSFSDTVREAPLTAIATAFIAGLVVSKLVF